MQWLDSPYPVALLIAATLSAILAFVAMASSRFPRGDTADGPGIGSSDLAVVVRL